MIPTFAASPAQASPPSVRTRTAFALLQTRTHETAAKRSCTHSLLCPRSLIGLCATPASFNAAQTSSRSTAAFLLGRAQRQHWPQRRRAVAAAAGWGGVAFGMPALAVVACTTLAFLAAAFVCLLLLLRPLLKKLESLAQAAELAVRSLEKASAEFEMASNVINSELPTTLESVERASVEFEVLGQSLNGLTGGLTGGRRKQSSPDRSKSPPRGGQAGAKDKDGSKAGGEWSAVDAITEGTANSMRKVAQDVAALTTALTPAMVAWRKRISFITERFEAASKEGEGKQLLGGNGTAAKQLPESAEAKQEVQAWVGEWRQRQQEMAAKARPSSNGATAAGPEGLAHAAEGAAAMAASLLDPSQPGPASDSGASEEERERSLEARRQAAHAVFAALSKAEEAASAAAAASGELETALQAAERQAGSSWWGWNPAAPKQPTPGGAEDGKQEHDGMAYPSSPFIDARSSSEGDEGSSGSDKESKRTASKGQADKGQLAAAEKS